METENPLREAVARSVITAAERGDRFAFISAVRRFGDLAEAQQLVRDQAVLRMVDRVVAEVVPGPEVVEQLAERAARAGEQKSAPSITGYFTVWDTWYEVNSFFEGNFMERTVRGSAKKTIAENRSNMRALFQHGMDPVAGDKPLGPLVDLREDEIGGFYQVDPLRNDDGTLVDYVASIVPGLRAGLYGSSFRFRTIIEEWNDEPKPSAANPKGLPERTLREMKVYEMGPVTFPANPAAPAGYRSAQILLPDGFELAGDDDRDEQLSDALSTRAADEHSDQESREHDTPADDALDEGAATEHSVTPSRMTDGGRLIAIEESTYRLDGRKEEPSWRL